jgi:hypothetical protein
MIILELFQQEDQEKRRLKFMTAEEFDKKFDDNEEDIIQYFDISKARRPNLEPKRINIDFPTWMVQSLDDEARHIGVSRQAIIKTWLAQRLQKLATPMVVSL